MAAPIVRDEGPVEIARVGNNGGAVPMHAPPLPMHAWLSRLLLLATASIWALSAFSAYR